MGQGAQEGFVLVNQIRGFPGGSSDKEGDIRDIRDRDSIPGLERSAGERNGNLFQHSCLENPTDRGAWRATVHSITELDTTEVT